MRKLIIIVFMVLASCFICAQAEEQDYTYPLTPESEDWFDYTPREKSEMLRIDEETLSQMTERQLVHAIADYPYLCDIHVYGPMSESVPLVEKYCSALSELTKREDFENKLQLFANELFEDYKTCPRSDGRTESVVSLLQDLIDYYQNRNSQESPELIDPNETSRSAPSVPYYLYSETHTVSAHDHADQVDILAIYNVSRVRIGSCRYNCHSYAWHSQSANNIYWIPNPTGYTTSGNYTSHYSGNISGNIMYSGVHVYDIVFYQASSISAMHSALFIDNPYSGTPWAQALLESKWGQYGVFQHRLTEVPPEYDYSYISVWH